nr:T-cell immunoreceptor with Ig and ITIM domains-like [Paramormyrops kingsleyae]
MCLVQFCCDRRIASPIGTTANQHQLQCDGAGGTAGPAEEGGSHPAVRPCRGHGALFPWLPEQLARVPDHGLASRFPPNRCHPPRVAAHKMSSSAKQSSASGPSARGVRESKMANLFIRVASRKQGSMALLYLHWFSASTAIRVVTPGNVTVQSGAKATLSCEMDEQGTIEQVEWSRCKQPQVLVFHSSFGLSVAPLYQGRITDVTVSGFTIGNTTVNDSGDYCCILTTFPHGTIENRLHLLIRPPDVSDQKSAISTMTVPIIIGVLCTALLVGVIFVTFHRRRRRPVQNPVHVVIHSDHSFYKKTAASPSSSPKASPSQSSHNGQEDGNHSDGDDYFNVTSK